MPLSPLHAYFLFNDTATTEIYPLSLHDALPICRPGRCDRSRSRSGGRRTGRWRSRDHHRRTDTAVDDAVLSSAAEQLRAIDDRLPRRNRTELRDHAAGIRRLGLVGLATRVGLDGDARAARIRLDGDRTDSAGR